MDLADLVKPSPLKAGSRLPWADPGFSRRMLHEHLDDRHDHASRSGATIDAHVLWLRGIVHAPARVLDVACGPGLYTQRLATIGYTCVGVDVSPAAIRYALDRMRDSESACSYRQMDLRTLDVGEEFGMVLLLYGELNTFQPREIIGIVEDLATRVAVGGRVVIELSTPNGVRRKAVRPSSWYRTDGGLFSDEPHLVLYESQWDAEEVAAVERWTVVEADARVARYETTTWLVSDRTVEALLETSGLRLVDRFGDLTGAPYDADADFQTLVLQRD